jgi:hypothetical protein
MTQILLSLQKKKKKKKPLWEVFVWLPFSYVLRWATAICQISLPFPLSSIGEAKAEISPLNTISTDILNPRNYFFEVSLSL